jgi:heme oxygenase
VQIDVREAHPPKTLSARLRHATAGIHARLEASPATADTGLTLGDYTISLCRLHAVFAPIEAHLAAFSGWHEAGLDISAHRRVPDLQADLAALRVDAASLKRAEIEAPENFPAAVGMLYVLEGSALGGRLILRAAEAQLGPAIAGATAFYASPRPLPWPAFKSRLDAFGETFPAAQHLVATGALAAFTAFASATAGLQNHPNSLNLVPTPGIEPGTY